MTREHLVKLKEFARGGAKCIRRASSRAARLVLGHGVRLEAVLHLEAVLDCAQEVVGVRKLAPLALADEAAVGEPTQDL